MKIKFVIFSLFMIFLAAPSFAQEWLTDFDTAISKAKEQDKPVLLFFTGSDWCPPCKMTAKNVYTKQEFIDFADEKLVLLLADFPRKRENQLPQDQQVKNRALSQEFGVRGFPTSIILDKEGKELGRWVGYDPSGVTGYIEKFSKAAHL